MTRQPGDFVARLPRCEKTAHASVPPQIMERGSENPAPNNPLLSLRQTTRYGNEPTQRPWGRRRRWTDGPIHEHSARRSGKEAR